MTDPGPQALTSPAGVEPPAEKRARPSTLAVAGFVLALMGPVLFWIWITFGAEEEDEQVHFVGTYGVLRGPARRVGRLGRVRRRVPQGEATP